MEFVLLKASDGDYREKIEINTLEELMKFVDECKHSLIIEKEYNHETDENENTLIIYDDYLE